MALDTENLEPNMVSRLRSIRLLSPAAVFFPCLGDAGGLFGPQNQQLLRSAFSADGNVAWPGQGDTSDGPVVDHRAGVRRSTFERKAYCAHSAREFGETVFPSQNLDGPSSLDGDGVGTATSVVSRGRGRDKFEQVPSRIINMSCKRDAPQGPWT